MTLILPAITSGNSVIALASRTAPYPAILLGEMLATSDLPGGVVNLLTGDRKDMLPTFATHEHIRAVAAVADKDDATTLQQGAVGQRQARENPLPGHRLVFRRTTTPPYADPRFHRSQNRLASDRRVTSNQRPHVRHGGECQSGGIVAALQHRDDPPAAPFPGQRHTAPGHFREGLIVPAKAADRIIHPGVEAGGNQQELRLKRIHRRRDLFVPGLQREFSVRVIRQRDVQRFVPSPAPRPRSDRVPVYG